MDKNKEIQTVKLPSVPEKKDSIFFQVNPQALISQAIDKNLNIETMERLLAMRRELKAEQAKEAYFQALTQFQIKCPTIEKKKKVYEKNNPKKVRYMYSPLEDIINQVKDILQECGFSYLIKVKQAKGWVTAICESHHNLGHSEATEFTVPVDESAYMSAPQKVASALTFAKRYAFCNAFGIMSADYDDDANITGGTEKIKTLPDDNDAFYKQCIVLINQRERNVDILTAQEKMQYKKNLDAVAGKIDDLKAFYQELNKIVQERVKDVRGEK